MESKPPADLIGANEAAKLVKVSGDTFRRWIETGKIAAWKIGTRWRVSRADVEALLVPFNPADVQRPQTRAEIAIREAWVDATLRKAGIRK